MSPVNRRQVAYLGGAIIAGVSVGHLIRRTAAVGREVEQTLATAILNGSGSPTSGPAGASVRLAVFTDYRCPACRRAFPAMEEAARNDGDVLTVYKDWPIFGPPSERAARVALASAEQGIYPAVHKRLMTDGRALTGNVLREAVIEAGGDWTRLTAYLASSHDPLTARLRLNGVQALSLGLPGTPGFLAGSTLVVGAIDERDFARLFALARVRS